MYSPLNEQETKRSADKEDMTPMVKKGRQATPEQNNGQDGDFRIMEHFVRAFFDDSEE